MAHLEKNIASSQACSGERGTYVATAYVLSGQTTRRRQVDLGFYTPAVETTGSVIDEVRDRLGHSLGQGKRLPLDEFVAVAVMRECQRKRVHVDRSLPTDRTQLERVGSYVLARADSRPEAIALSPLKQLRQVSAHGFGHANRAIEGMLPISNLIYLPTTLQEDVSMAVTSAIEAYPYTRQRSQQPFVALHGADGDYIEQLVTADQLA